jgi:hypothetical protein
MTLFHKISVCLLCCLAAPVMASQDITINVPVHAQNLHPEITSISVGCHVGSAYGRKDLPVFNRAYNGTVSVKVSVTDGESASVNSYQCQLALMTTGGPGYYPQQNGVGPPQGQAKPGTPFVVKIQGPIGATKGFSSNKNTPVTNLPPTLKKP